MKNKLKLLIKDGLNKKINTKWFKVVNIILLVVIVGLINIDNIIKFFGGNFDDPIVIYVIDNTNKYYEAIKSGYDNIDLSALGSESEIKLADKSLDELKEEMVNDESNDIILVINSNNGKVVADVISYNYVDAVTLQVLNSTLSSVKTNIALMESSLTEEELASIYEPVEINRSYLSDNLDENNDKKPTKLTKKEKLQTIDKIEAEMKEAAKELDFERAMQLRDILFEMKGSK